MRLPMAIAGMMCPRVCSHHRPDDWSDIGLGGSLIHYEGRVEIYYSYGEWADYSTVCDDSWMLMSTMRTVSRGVSGYRGSMEES